MLTRLVRTYARPYRRSIAVVFALLAVQAGGNLYLPNLTADIINNGVAKGDVGYIWRIGAQMLAVTLVVGIVAVGAVYGASKASMAIGRDIRRAVFVSVQRFSAREMNGFGTPSLITRNTNDVQQIQVFAQLALTVMVIAPIMCVGGVILALREDATLSLLIVVVVPVMAAVVGLLLFLALPLFRSMQVRIDRVNLVLREQITGVRVIRAFVRTRHEAQRFAEANASLTDTGLRVNRIFAFAIPALMLILNLSSVAVIWFGGHLVNSGEMPIGNLTAFLAYILQILIAVMMAVMMAISIPRASASAARIEEVLRAEPSIIPPEHPVAADRSVGVVEFRGVGFGYPGGERPVLQDITFTLHPGETTAIIGATGSGKSTLLDLVMRAFDPTAGSVLVGGVDARAQSLESLWDQIGVVPQKAYLFTGTVAANLRLGREDATDAELWNALEVAQARDFVAAMTGGLDAIIDQAGTNVSGGQRQRLSIARALVKRPVVYLFDDCFSALDAATDANLRAALPAYTQDATLLIVAQRVSTILGADRILVLDGGRIVGSGTHADLLAGCEPYREIVESQLGANA